MEKRNYYCILGVSPEESPGGIRAAYRDRVKKLHPDLAGEESTRAFQELTEAYGVLSDPERRVEYNRRLGRAERGGSAVIVVTRRQPVSEARPLRRDPASILGNPEGIRPSFEALAERLLRNFTGIGAPKAERPEPLSFEVILTKEEARQGCVVPVGVPVFRRCPTCRGSGRDWAGACARCHGTGFIEHEFSLDVALPPRVPSGTRFEVSLETLGIQNLYLSLYVSVEP